MSKAFEQIKDAGQLQEYLSKHADSGKDRNANAVIKSNNVTASNDYMGIKKLRASNAVRTGSPSPGASPAAMQTLSDRYEKRMSVRKGDATSRQPDEEAHELDGEQRSLHAEIDYSRKDATRHIVQSLEGSVTKKQRLRQKILRNLEGVRKDRAILPSELGSVRSIRSRFSNISARQS